MQKRTLSLALVAALLGLNLYITACQKEDSSTPPVVEVQPAANATDDTAVADRSVLITASVSALCGCKDGSCNSFLNTSGNRRNGIRIVLSSLTHNYYNVTNGGPLTYSIYGNNSCSGAPLATFTCSNQTVDYWSASLTNNTTYTVRIFAGSATSPCYSVLTSNNCTTLPCISPK